MLWKCLAGRHRAAAESRSPARLLFYIISFPTAGKQLYCDVGLCLLKGRLCNEALLVFLGALRWCENPQKGVCSLLMSLRRGIKRDGTPTHKEGHASPLFCLLMCGSLSWWCILTPVVIRCQNHPLFHQREKNKRRGLGPGNLVAFRKSITRDKQHF